VRVLGGISAILVAAAACGWTPADEQVLIQFFELSRIYDRTRLADLATVVFDPRTDGIVDRFEIVGRGGRQQVSPERVRMEVTLSADVRSPGGRVTARTLVVMMEQRDGRWMVTGFR
jgi:hypothetical protein